MIGRGGAEFLARRAKKIPTPVETDEPDELPEPVKQPDPFLAPRRQQTAPRRGGFVNRWRY
jgi:hypothetical protein